VAASHRAKIPVTDASAAPIHSGGTRGRPAGDPCKTFFLKYNK